jgi:hypothetical protein
MRLGVSDLARGIVDVHPAWLKRVLEIDEELHRYKTNASQETIIVPQYPRYTSNIHHSTTLVRTHHMSIIQNEPREGRGGWDWGSLGSRVSGFGFRVSGFGFRADRQAQAQTLNEA